MKRAKASNISHFSTDHQASRNRKWALRKSRKMPLKLSNVVTNPVEVIHNLPNNGPVLLCNVMSWQFCIHDFLRSNLFSLYQRTLHFRSKRFIYGWMGCLRTLASKSCNFHPFLIHFSFFSYLRRHLVFLRFLMLSQLLMLWWKSSSVDCPWQGLVSTCVVGWKKKNSFLLCF